MAETKKKKIGELSGVVHDARQMLAVILGRTGLLQRGVKDSVLLRHLKDIELATESLESLLLRVSNESFTGVSDIREAIVQSLSLIQPEAGQDWQQDFSTEDEQKTGVWLADNSVLEGVYCTVPTDVLREVLNNLLHNSLAVLPQGGKVRFRLESDEDFCTLFYHDSGPGISAENSSQIFEPGFSTSGDSKKGVGLPYCRQILNSCGGQINWVSTQEQGACFALTLPRSNQPEKVKNSTVETRLDVGVFSASVLVVDDDSSVREMLADVLVEFGCRATEPNIANIAVFSFGHHKEVKPIVIQKTGGETGIGK